MMLNRSRYRFWTSVTVFRPILHNFIDLYLIVTLPFVTVPRRYGSSHNVSSRYLKTVSNAELLTFKLLMVRNDQ